MPAKGLCSAAQTLPLSGLRKLYLRAAIPAYRLLDWVR